MLRFLLTVFFTITTALIIKDHYPQGQVQYNFVHVINDPLLNELENQWERNNGDNVQGYYRLFEADETARNFDYSTDARNIFNSIVRHDVQGAAKTPPVMSPAKRNYYGALFVQEREYGREMGFVQ